MAGFFVGAGLARAIIGPPRHAPDPALVRAADRAVASRRDGEPVSLVVNAAYHDARPACPRQLDPDNPEHAECIQVWLRLRDLVVAMLPPPAIPAPDDAASGLSQEGPAADVRAWLSSLTAEQRAGLRDLVGAKHYDGIAGAAAAGNDRRTRKAMRALQDDLEQLADDHPLEAMRKYAALQSLLGDKLDELSGLAAKYESG